MDSQIEKDFAYFENKTISLASLDALFEKKGTQLQLVKYTILDNKILVDQTAVDAKKYKERINRYADIFTLLCKTKGLPDTTILLSINDGLNAKTEIPIFGMCKKDSDRIILIPDYEALGTRYQVLKYDLIDITLTHFPWENKKSQLMWRGSTGQLFLKLTEKNLPLFSRVKLCELSVLHPDMIDAKFTLFVQGGQFIPSLYNFEGEQISFLDQMNYKYHILIDGNVSPYTKSGWKLFTNSLIFKPQSNWKQWYFDCLKPNVHYISVKSDLSDLIQKLDWAMENDLQSKEIAANCRNFAVNQFTFDNHLLYLYKVILHYHALHFVL
jgi:Glycosyl transferase family 90